MRASLRVCAQHSPAVFSQVVFMREREKEQAFSVGIPAHFVCVYSWIPLFTRETCYLPKVLGLEVLTQGLKTRSAIATYSWVDLQSAIPNAQTTRHNR